MSPRPPFKFAAKTRVGFSDTDAQGIVYYGRYMPYFDLARVEYHRALDMLRTGPEAEQFVMRAMTTEYLAPARFDDEIEVDVRISADRHVERHLRVRRIPPRTTCWPSPQARPWCSSTSRGTSRAACRTGCARRSAPSKGSICRHNSRASTRSRRTNGRCWPVQPLPSAPHSCCRRETRHECHPPSEVPAPSADDPSTRAVYGVTRYASKTASMLRSAVSSARSELDVADLGRVPVLRELILDAAAVGDDVRAVLGERPGDVLEQARAVPRVDRDLDAEALRRAALPLDRREPLRVLAQRLTFGQSSRWIVIPLPSEM